MKAGRGSRHRSPGWERRAVHGTFWCYSQQSWNMSKRPSGWYEVTRAVVLLPSWSSEPFQIANNP